jgi:hypothetical protein
MTETEILGMDDDQKELIIEVYSIFKTPLNVHVSILSATFRCFLKIQ